MGFRMTAVMSIFFSLFIPLTEFEVCIENLMFVTGPVYVFTEFFYVKG
jgi:hypothetical protein